MRRAVYWYPFGTDLKDKTKQKATKRGVIEETQTGRSKRQISPPTGDADGSVKGHQPLTSRGMGAWDGAASGRVGVSQNCCETGINLVFLCS